jgi:phosphate transport system substrate-binding protein
MKAILKEAIMKNTIRFLATAIFVLALSGIAPAIGQELIGAGATFPYPLYSKMFDVYSKEYQVKVNYQAIGSGGGIRQLINKTVDFGGTDAVMSAEDLQAAGSPVLHVPVVAGAVVVTYNIAGNPEVKLAPDLVADIFLGKIKKWNDPRIVSANAGIKLPDMAITVVHRSDGSGTTFIFADYLSKTSKEWKDKVGTGTSLNWPIGLGGKGNPGVAGLVQQTPGSAGYVELVYALQNKMAYAGIKNRKGNSIKPTIASTSQAANISLPDNMMVSLTDTDAADGYPVAGFTWVLVYKEQRYGERSEAKAGALTKLVWWMTHEGQKYAEPMQYAPLSKAAVEKAEKLIKSVTYGGNPIMK